MRRRLTVGAASIRIFSGCEEVPDGIRDFFGPEFVTRFTNSSNARAIGVRRAVMVSLFLPVLLFVVFAAALSIVLALAGRLLGPHRDSAVKRMPYESGMDPIHDSRRRFDVRFHLVAIAFLVFDVELLFLYPWAVASRPGRRKRRPPTEPRCRRESMRRCGTIWCRAADWFSAK